MATVFLAALIASHLVLVASEVAMAASQDNNKEANAVEAKIYLYSVDRWKNDGSPVFTKAMADNANKHCNKSFQECCLFQNWTTSSTRFTEKDIITDFSGYPETKRPYMTVKLGMMIPSALSSYTDIACANHSYVVKAAVIRIMEQSRTIFSDKTDHYITSIEENRYPLPPNNLINYIMIPISVALVIICIILLIILMWKCGGPPEPVFKLEHIKASSVTTTMTPTAVEVQVEPASNCSGVKKGKQPVDQQLHENGNNKDDQNEEINKLVSDDTSKELSSQQNSGFEPSPVEETENAIDEIEKELANIK